MLSALENKLDLNIFFLFVWIYFFFWVRFLRPKRHAKQTADEGYWDCSVCTFRNTAEAFKCSICDVRKGTSTR